MTGTDAADVAPAELAPNLAPDLPPNADNRGEWESSADKMAGDSPRDPEGPERLGTPDPVQNRQALPVADRACEGWALADSNCRPPACKGDIADAIRATQPDVDLPTVEFNGDLRAVIEAKGHEVVGDDFFEHQGKHDRIIMNPPFENGQDIDHVRHAFECLKPGGRVVAIMSNGPFFRSDKKSQEFRAWLDDHGLAEQLPDGSFAHGAFRATGVRTQLVVIDKWHTEKALRLTIRRPVRRIA